MDLSAIMNDMKYKGKPLATRWKPVVEMTVKGKGE